jgi:hypothetical protein
MFVLMHQNAPLPSHLNAYADFADRFWYWHGASGRQYIHSVYKPRTCPLLPGGVFLAVKREGDVRRALAVGLFADFWEEGGSDLAAFARAADEIHVHLLARGPEDAQAVARDLASAVAASDPSHAPGDHAAAASIAEARAA